MHDCWGQKIDRLAGIIPRRPIIAQCSIFNEILPIREQWVSHLNDGHSPIRIHWEDWAISAKNWDVAVFQWSIVCCVRKKINIGKCCVSFNSRNASFDGVKTKWRRNIISPDATKGRLIWINGYLRWHFITVGVELIVDFPQQSSVKKKRGEYWMDVPYRISEGIVL